MAVIFSKKQLWEQSLGYFDKFYINGHDLKCSPNEVLFLIQTLLNQTDNIFKTYNGDGFVNIIKKSCPPIAEEIDALFKHTAEKKEAERKQRNQESRDKYKKIMFKSMAYNQFETLEATYSSFDIQYQNVWTHGSLICAELGSFLDPLDTISQTIHTNYQSLMNLKDDVGAYADNIGSIMELGRILRKNFDDFFHQMISINIEISRKRRQLHKEASSTRAFHEFEPTTISGAKNLKAEIMAEQAKKQQEAIEKGKAAEENQQERQKRREALRQVHELQQQVPNANTITGLSVPTPASQTLHFTNTEIHDFWEKHTWARYFTNDDHIQEMLSALDKAQSTYHLKSLLPPGTRLEKLDGDRKGQLSLRVNDQWRLCFYWMTGQGALNIEFVDYH